MACDRRYCDGCPLDGRVEPYELDAPGTARFLVVTDSPSLAAAREGRIMSRDAMSVFVRTMRHEQFTSGDFGFVPQVRCPHDPDKYSTAEKRDIQNHCRQYLLDDIRAMRPEVIIPLGADAAKQVTGRAVKITKVRGVAEKSQELRSVVMPFLKPDQIVLYPQHQSTFSADAATLGRLVDHDYNVQAASRAVTGEYEYVDDLEFLIRENPTRIGFDTEGSGLRMTPDGNLRWYAPEAKILTMQFCVEPGRAYMLPWDHPESPFTARQKSRLKKQIIQLLCRPEVLVVGQNLKFDALMMLTQTGIRIKIGSDTLMLAALVDENAMTKNLDDLVRRYVPEMAGYADRFNATVDKSQLDKHPLDENFLDYGCGDADAALRLEEVLYRMVEADPKLLAHYTHVSLPGVNAFTAMETRGMYVNESEVDNFEAHMQEKLKEQYASLLRQVPRSIKRLHVDKGLKFTRKEFLLDILFRHPDGFKLRPRAFTKGTAKLDPARQIPSTSTKDHLPFFYEDCPFTFELSQYIKDERLLSTNVIGFRNKYLVDGMVRPTYRLDVAVTGRSSSEDPNSQNYPKRGATATAYRRLFVAPEGKYFLEADLSQAELRISGDMANDPTMLRIYAEHGDIHTETALIVMGISRAEFDRLPPDEQKLARFKAKAVNFGFIYGMGWRKFVVYARTQYGVTFTDNEARRIRDAFFEKYHMLSEWHQRVREFARQHKMVRSYSGRVRHLPMIDSADEGVRSEAERQAINSPVQEFGSSLGVMAFSRIEEEIDPEYLSVVSFVHDAIYCYVPQEYLEWGALTLKRYMESTPIQEWFGIKMKAPIVADVSFGMNLGEMNELKGLQLSTPRTVRARAAHRGYDFSKFWNEEEQKGIIVPEQLIPPNGGRRIVSPYTEWREAA